MPHWKLTLTYDGSPFHGWQVQPGLPTVQGTLAAALGRLTGETVLPQGSGRTDAGVHALGQVCSFALRAPIPAPNLQRALNRILPAAIRVLAAEPVHPAFHARHSALRKTYEYRLFERRPRSRAELRTDCPSAYPPDPSETERPCSPFLAPYVWDVRWPLDLSVMQQAATLLCGTHDFTSFAAADPDQAARSTSQPALATAVRTLFASAFEHRDNLLVYRVTGTGFLHHMVRNLVGTLVDVGRGGFAPDCIPAILSARDRSAAGPTAPAAGLFLVQVVYPEPGLSLHPFPTPEPASPEAPL